MIKDLLAAAHYAGEKRLVRRLLAGDERAFNEFFNTYFARLFQFARLRLNDENFAEEVVQATLSKALQKMDTFRGEASLYTWLCTICRREISSLLQREAKHEDPIELIDNNLDLSASLESLTEYLIQDPSLHIEQWQLQSLVHSALSYLPPPYGDLLEWKYIQGYSVKEIAIKLKRSNKATESLLTRARVAFKEAFTSLASELAQQKKS